MIGSFDELRLAGTTLLLAGADTSGAPDGGSLQSYLVSLLTPAERGSVRFLGRLRPEALGEEYAGAAVCVVPSLWENYPNTCIEAMLHARPVVVSDNGGMAEMIGETEAGLVCRAWDPVTLERTARSTVAVLNQITTTNSIPAELFQQYVKATGSLT